MTQCAGKTRRGERCRREAREGSAYCSIHVEQEAGAAREASPKSEPKSKPRSEKSRDDPEFVLKAALGLAALAAIVLFRIRR